VLFQLSRYWTGQWWSPKMEQVAPSVEVWKCFRLSFLRNTSKMRQVQVQGIRAQKLQNWLKSQHLRCKNPSSSGENWLWNGLKCKKNLFELIAGASLQRSLRAPSWIFGKDKGKREGKGDWSVTGPLIWISGSAMACKSVVIHEWPIADSCAVIASTECVLMLSCRMCCRCARSR